jgi:hypothetical protein
MNTRNQSEPPAKLSFNEDYQERGLRILGMLIARRLLKQRSDNKDKPFDEKTDDSTISEDDI